VTRFSRSLNYSSVNEDWRTERAALSPGDEDRILCITGSGDRPLNLLALSRARITAVDVNPAQNRLLRLKMLAMRELQFEEYVMFLGLEEADERWRLATFRTLAGGLSPEDRQFWRDHSSMIARGVIYAGRWERHYRRLSRFGSALRGRTIAALFELDNMESQRRFVSEQWERTWWRGVFTLSCSPAASFVLLGDPAFYRNVHVRVGSYIYHRMTRSLRTHLARENFMMSLVLRGHLSSLDLPPWLTRAGVAVIRERLDALTEVTADLVSLLDRGGAEPFTRFSLSDVPSYLDGEQYERLLLSIAHHAPEGARLCMRHFLTRQQWPRIVRTRLVRDEPLERHLAETDRAFAYEFRIGRVMRGSAESP
jgi:S-adenosylmethionine-diacylglycerol 3-amino-3-carboxypropyl transferase